LLHSNKVCFWYKSFYSLCVTSKMVIVNIVSLFIPTALHLNIYLKLNHGQKRTEVNVPHFSQSSAFMLFMIFSLQFPYKFQGCGSWSVFNLALWFGQIPPIVAEKWDLARGVAMHAYAFYCFDRLIYGDVKRLLQRSRVSLGCKSTFNMGQHLDMIWKRNNL